MPDDNKIIAPEEMGLMQQPGKSIEDKTKEYNAMPTEAEGKLPVQDLLGVKDTKEFIELLGAGFDAVHEANKNDGKIDFPGDYIAIGSKTMFKVIPAFSGIANIPKEILFDKLSDNDVAELASALDSCKNLKGDTRDAVKELLPIIADINNWRLKYFG